MFVITRFRTVFLVAVYPNGACSFGSTEEAVKFHDRDAAEIVLNSLNGVLVGQCEVAEVGPETEGDSSCT